jgi:Ion channel
VGNVQRIQLALLAVLAAMTAGSIGYVVLGFSPLDAIYQTVTTISTVGFREIQPLSTAGKIFTIALIIAGVGTALYAFSLGCPGGGRPAGAKIGGGCPPTPSLLGAVSPSISLALGAAFRVLHCCREHAIPT